MHRYRLGLTTVALCICLVPVTRQIAAGPHALVRELNQAHAQTWPLDGTSTPSTTTTSHATALFKRVSSDDDDYDLGGNMYNNGNEDTTDDDDDDHDNDDDAGHIAELWEAYHDRERWQHASSDTSSNFDDEHARDDASTDSDAELSRRLRAMWRGLATLQGTNNPQPQTRTDGGSIRVATPDRADVCPTLDSVATDTCQSRQGDRHWQRMCSDPDDPTSRPETHFATAYLCPEGTQCVQLQWQMSVDPYTNYPITIGRIACERSSTKSKGRVFSSIKSIFTGRRSQRSRGESSSRGHALASFGTTSMSMSIPKH